MPEESKGYKTWRACGTGEWLLIATLGDGGRFGSAGGQFLSEAGEFMLFRPGTQQDHGGRSEPKAPGAALDPLSEQARRDERILESQPLHRAQQLLELTPRPISATAAEAGSENPFYFIRRFKRAAGLSPRDYVIDMLPGEVPYTRSGASQFNASSY